MAILCFVFSAPGHSLGSLGVDVESDAVATVFSAAHAGYRKERREPERRRSRGESSEEAAARGSGKNVVAHVQVLRAQRAPLCARVRAVSAPAAEPACVGYGTSKRRSPVGKAP